MDLAQLMRVTVIASIVLITFSLGLRSTPNDAMFLLREPRLLFRSLLAMNVVLPLFAILLVKAFDLNPAVKIALVALAVSPVPPFLPGKQLRLVNRESYVYGLLVAVSLLAIVLVPLTIALLNSVFASDLQIAPAAVARVVAITVLLPLILGMLVRHRLPEFAARAAPHANRLGTALLMLALVLLLVATWRAMSSLIGDGTLLAIALFVATGLAVGHLLGGPDADDRSVLALATSSRHPGVALAIATANFPDQKLVPAALVLYLLVNALVSAPYTVWRKRRRARLAMAARTS